MTPIRESKNAESMGVPYPKNQTMRIYSSLWNADGWACEAWLNLSSLSTKTSMPMLAFGHRAHLLAVLALLRIRGSLKSWTPHAKRGWNRCSRTTITALTQTGFPKASLLSATCPKQVKLKNNWWVTMWINCIKCDNFSICTN